MSTQDWKAEARARIRKSIAHLSNAGKPDRERWVAERFLTHLGVGWADGELTKPEEPADVAFRDARFQVKELLDANRKRHDEYWADLQRLDTARTPADMFTHYEPTTLAIGDMVARVENLAAEVCGQYGHLERRGLDLLVYVNLLDVDIVNDGTPFALTRPPGFRSLSFIADGMAVVIWAAEAAPDFLREAAGTVRRCQHGNS